MICGINYLICTHSGSLTLGEYPQTSGHPSSPILSRSCRRLDRETQNTNKHYIHHTQLQLCPVCLPQLTSRWRRLVSVAGHRLSSHSNRILIQTRDHGLSDLTNLFPLTWSDCENNRLGSGFCSSLCRCILICGRLHARVCGSSALGPVSGCWSGVSSGSRRRNILRPTRALLKTLLIQFNDDWGIFYLLGA